MGSHLRVVFENRRASNLLNVIDRCRQSDRAGNVRCAGFETMRRFLETAFLQGHAHDHFAATVPGRHRIKNSLPAVKHADTGRSTHLVTGESEEIAAESLDIDR